jgi:hypothetical protein
LDGPVWCAVAETVHAVWQRVWASFFRLLYANLVLLLVNMHVIHIRMPHATARPYAAGVANRMRKEHKGRFVAKDITIKYKNTNGETRVSCAEFGTADEHMRRVSCAESHACGWR